MIPKILNTLQYFIFLFLEISLLFIFISILVTILNHRYSHILEKHLKKETLLSYIKALLLGILTPFCSCSTIPLFNAFLKNGVPLGICSAYLFISPLLNPIILIMLLTTLGIKITFLYTLFLLVTILAIAIIISKFNPKKLISNNSNLTQNACCKKPLFSTTKTIENPSILLKPNKIIHNSKQPPLQKPSAYKNIIFETLKDYKKMLPYIIIGMGIGALIHGFIPQNFLENQIKEYGLVGIVIAPIIGILLYIRAEAIIPIGLSLINIGIPESIVMSFLIAGSGCSLPELILLKQNFSFRFLAIFISTILIISISFGILLEFV